MALREELRIQGSACVFSVLLCVFLCGVMLYGSPIS